MKTMPNLLIIGSSASFNFVSEPLTKPSTSTQRYQHPNPRKYDIVTELLAREARKRAELMMDIDNGDEAEIADAEVKKLLAKNELSDSETKKLLYADEKLDRSSPELWPEQGE